jgi:hypothetical protein
MKRERISPTTEMMMNFMAWGAYGTNFLIEIIAGWFGIGLIASIVFMIGVYACFAMWFLFKGVNVFSPKLVGNFAFGAIISAIPIINLFYISFDKKTGIPTPGVRKNVGRVIHFVQEEDRKFNRTQQSKKEINIQKQTAMQTQQAKAARLQQIRQQQDMQREEQRVNAQNETNMMNQNDEDLYEDAA